MKRSKVSLLFDIRDLTLTLFITSSIFGFASYVREENSASSFGSIILASFVIGIVLNMTCNLLKVNQKKNKNKRLFKNNTIIHTQEKKQLTKVINL